MAHCVRILDTTLRDGEQAPGCSMSTRQKIAIARQLPRLNVDIIEAGFPASSAAEAEAVSAVARAVGSLDGPVICGLARATPRDIVQPEYLREVRKVNGQLMNVELETLGTAVKDPWKELQKKK